MTVCYFTLTHLQHILMFVTIDYREAGRVSVFQKGLKNDRKVVPEEAITVQQLFKPFLEFKIDVYQLLQLRRSGNWLNQT